MHAATPKFRLGVIGLGFGSAVLIPSFAGIDGVEIAAVAGRRYDKAREVAVRFGNCIACQSVDELLDAGIDAVAIALPPQVAGDVAGKALGHGLAVFMEKPLAGDAPRASALARQAIGTTTAIDFQFIEIAAFQALKDMVERRELGAIRKVELEWRSTSYAYRTKKWSWKTDRSQSGGVLTMSGTHAFHLVEWMFGPVTIVEARLSNAAAANFAPPGGLPAEDDAILLMQAENGFTIHIHLANASHDVPLHRWIVEGEEGTALLENPLPTTVAGFQLTVVTKDGRRRMVAREPISEGDDRIVACRRLAARFVDAARRGDRIDPDFAAGARVQAFVDAARRDAIEVGPHFHAR